MWRGRPTQTGPEHCPKRSRPLLSCSIMLFSYGLHNGSPGEPVSTVPLSTAAHRDRPRLKSPSRVRSNADCSGVDVGLEAARFRSPVRQNRQASGVHLLQLTSAVCQKPSSNRLLFPQQIVVCVSSADRVPPLKSPVVAREKNGTSPSWRASPSSHPAARRRRLSDRSEAREVARPHRRRRPPQWAKIAARGKSQLIERHGHKLTAYPAH